MWRERRKRMEIDQSFYQCSAAEPGWDWFSGLCGVTSLDLSLSDGELVFLLSDSDLMRFCLMYKEKVETENRNPSMEITIPLLTSESNTLSPYLWELSSRIPKRVSRVSCRNWGREQNKKEVCMCDMNFKKSNQKTINTTNAGIAGAIRSWESGPTLTISEPSISFSLERLSLILSGWARHFSRSSMSPGDNKRHREIEVANEGEQRGKAQSRVCL